MGPAVVGSWGGGEGGEAGGMYVGGGRAPRRARHRIRSLEGRGGGEMWLREGRCGRGEREIGT